MKKKIYTVERVTKYISNLFVEDFFLQQISVSGEISNCKYHSTGHIYFTLKDEKAAMQGMMFRDQRRSGLSFDMKDGDKVVITGSVRVFERDGKYQIYAREIVPQGLGDLYQKYLQIHESLKAAGYFDTARKKTIPKYVQKIGIVTAPTGAAVRDIIRIATRRNPKIDILLYPALVQGEGAVESIVQGIAILDQLGLDVIIVGRGGGSIEDLWAFNEVEVAEAVFACSTPIISAVGHETDTTICDYVADLRASTPSAAAEQAVFVYEEFLKELQETKKLLENKMLYHLTSYQLRLSELEKRLLQRNPSEKKQEQAAQLYHLSQRLQNAMEKKHRDLQYKLGILLEQLEGNSPAKRLAAGYAFVADEQGKRISSIQQLNKGQMLQLHMALGSAMVEVKEIKEE